MLKRFIIVGLVLVTSTAAYAASKKKNNEFKGELGLRIPQVAITIDAVYDARLDTVVPGYKLVNIIIVNDSTQKLFFNPEKDRWKIDDAYGEPQPAIASLKHNKTSVWKALSPDVQANLEYPLAIDVGQKAIFALFFKENVELREFRSLTFQSSYLKKTLTYYSSGIPWQTPEEEPIEGQ